MNSARKTVQIEPLGMIIKLEDGRIGFTPFDDTTKPFGAVILSALNDAGQKIKFKEIGGLQDGNFFERT